MKTIITFSVEDDYEKLPFPGRDKLLAALRSGKFKKGRYDLKNAALGESEYCCLGVICELQGRLVPYVLNKNMGQYSDANSTGNKGWLSKSNPLHPILKALGELPNGVVFMSYCIDFAKSGRIDSLALINDITEDFTAVIIAIENVWYDPGGEDSFVMYDELMKEETFQLTEFNG